MEESFFSEIGSIRPRPEENALMRWGERRLIGKPIELRESEREGEREIAGKGGIRMKVREEKK